jgi:hypothetical protein
LPSFTDSLVSCPTCILLGIFSIPPHPNYQY